MNSLISRHVSDHEHLALSWVDATDVVRTIACDQHALRGEPALQMGEVLVGALAISTRLKGAGTLTVICTADDEDSRLRTLRADAIGLGDVRGLARPGGEDLDVLDTLGPGSITVGRQLAGSERPYRSVLACGDERPLTRINQFLHESDQVSGTVIGDVVLDPDGGLARARALYAEILPGAPEPGSNEITDQVRGWLKSHPRPDWDRLPDGEAVIAHLLGRGTCSELHRYDVRFHCPCSRQRFVRSLAGFPPSELKELTDGSGVIATTCDFCRTAYDIPLDELI